MSCRVRDTESDLQAERLWLTLPSLEWWGGHGVFWASPGHREADPQEGDPSSGRWELIVILRDPGNRGTRVTSPTAQPHLWTEPQGSVADFTYFSLRTATTAQPCQPCQPCVGHCPQLH